MTENSPGRGPSGKLRNFKSMSAEKLQNTISDLRAYGEDPEALNAALAVAGLPAEEDAEPRPKLKANKPIRSDDPIGAGRAVKDLAMKGKNAKTVEEAIGNADAVMEAKYDGHRVLVHVGAKAVRVYSGKQDKTDRVPHITEAVREAFEPGTWLDGEAIANHGTTAGWGVVQSVMGTSTRVHPKHLDVRLNLFDMLSFDGLDLRSLPLHARRQALEDLYERQPIQYVELTERFPATDAVYGALVEKGFEGVMVKHVNSLYRSGMRGPGWFKVKAAWTDEAVVIGYEPGKGSFSGMVGAIEFGQFSNGKLIRMGTCSGMDMRVRQDITDNQDKYLGRVFEFRHMGAQPTGGYRHPQWKRWRDEKAAEDCVVGVGMQGLK